MSDDAQSARAERFRALHLEPRLLVLPNIWDPLGALMLQELGFPAVATASAAVAYSLGRDDGERIGFDEMLGVIERIAAAVDVPLTADIERGYGATEREVADNVGRVLVTGAVGINIEDSFSEGGALRPAEEQCARIAAARARAGRDGVPLVINARTDVWLGGFPESKEQRLEETIRRARAYLDAGADCIYPIGLVDLEALSSIRAATEAPLNVYASAAAPPMRELEAAGVSRLSLGPGLIRASLTAMKQVAEELARYGSYDAFTRDAISSEEIRRYIREPS